jgi:hypothetical protein
VPAISVGEDSVLLTDTPIPIPHLTDTPTITVTPLPTFTFTPTPTTKPTPIPTLAETAALSSLAKHQPSPSANGNNNEPLARPNLVARLVASQQAPTVDPSTRGLNSFQEQGFFEAGLGLDPPILGSTVPWPAVGAKAAVGVLFNDGFAIQVDLEYFSRSNTNTVGTISESEVLVLPTLRRYLMVGNVRPYLSIGDGLAVNMTTSGFTSSSINSFDLALGGGVDFLLDNYFSTYVEGKYNFVFMSASPNQDLPLAIGARLGL